MSKEIKNEAEELMLNTLSKWRELLKRHTTQWNMPPHPDEKAYERLIEIIIEHYNPKHAASKDWPDIKITRYRWGRLIHVQEIIQKIKAIFKKPKGGGD